MQLEAARGQQGLATIRGINMSSEGGEGNKSPNCVTRGTAMKIHNHVLGRGGGRGVGGETTVTLEIPPQSLLRWKISHPMLKYLGQLHSKSPPSNDEEIYSIFAHTQHSGDKKMSHFGCKVEIINTVDKSESIV